MDTASIDYSPLYYIVPIFILMAALVVYTIVYSYRQRQDMLAAARKLGFTLLGKPEASFLQRLRETYKPARLTQVTNLAMHAESIGRIYLFDAFTSNPGQNKSGNSESRNVAIVSPDLDLPPFFLMNRLPQLGPFGNALNSFIAKAASWSGYSEWGAVPPDFNLRYQLYVREDSRVERVFTDHTLSQIAQTPNILARGENDLLIFNTFDMRGGAKIDAVKLADHIQKARDFYECLRR